MAARRDLEAALAGYRARELYETGARAGTARVVIVQEDMGPPDRLRPLALAVAALPQGVLLGATRAPAGVILASAEDSGVDAGRLVGIVTRADLVRAFVESLPAAEGKDIVPDAEIRERIVAEIAKQRWARTASIEVHVVRGEVEFRGTVIEERARSALQVIAENVAGVRKVSHRLVWLGGQPRS